MNGSQPGLELTLGLPDGFDYLGSLLGTVDSIMPASPVNQVFVGPAVRMCNCRLKNVVRVLKSLHHRQSLGPQYLQKPFPLATKQLESRRVQNAGFVDLPRPLDQFLEAVEKTEVAENGPQLRRTGFFEELEVVAVNGVYGVSRSSLSQSNTCVAVPGLLLAEPLLHPLCQFQGHVLDSDTGEVPEDCVDEEGTVEAALVNLDRQVSFCEFLEVLDAGSQFSAFLEAHQGFEEEAGDLEHQDGVLA